MEDYFNFVNETKLLGSDTIQCTIRDDQYQTSVTKRNFEEFLDDGIVLYLNYSTGSTLGLKKDFEEEKIAVIPASFHAGNLTDSTYIFLPIASYSEQVVSLAEYIADHHKGTKAKVAMFIHPSAFGRGAGGRCGKVRCRRIEHRDCGGGGAWKGPGQHCHAQTTHEQRRSVCDLSHGAVAGGGHDQRCQPAGSGGPDLWAGGQNNLHGCPLHRWQTISLIWPAWPRKIFIGPPLTTSPRRKNEGTKKQLALAKMYHRDEKAANSHNYANGIMVAQVATEVIRRAKEKGLEINRENLYNELNAMHGDNAYTPYTHGGTGDLFQDRPRRCGHASDLQGQGRCFQKGGGAHHVEVHEKNTIGIHIIGKKCTGSEQY